MRRDDTDRWDVFLSYARRDRAQAAPLAESMRRRGLRVFVDEADAAGFASLNAELRAALAGSRILVAYYSTTYPSRPSCQHELTAAFLAGQREGDPRRRIALVNPEDGQGHILPAELRDIRHWPWPQDDAAAERFLQSLEDQLAALSGPVGDVLAPPEAQVAGFVGRQRELWRLHSFLTRPSLPLAGTSGPRTCLLTGLPGIGKSALARQYAAMFGPAFSGGVVWTGLDDPGSGAADRLAVIDLPPGVEAERVGAWLRERPASEAALLIADARLDLPADVLRVSGLDGEAAQALLWSYREPEGDEDAREAERLAVELGGHPQALHLAGHMARTEGSSPYREVRRRWLTGRHDAPAETAARLGRLADGYPADPGPALRRKLAELSEGPLDALRLLSILPPELCGRGRLASVWTAVTHDAEPLPAALEVLARHGLCARGAGDLWESPPLVRRTALRGDPDPVRARQVEQIAWRTLVGYPDDPDATAAGETMNAPPLSRAEQEAAFRLQIELATRVSTVPLGGEDGLLREALSSLKAVLDSARDCLTSLAGSRRGDDVLELSQRVIDEIRPVLARWHPLLLDHESVRPADVGPKAHERGWSRDGELRRELAGLQDQMRDVLGRLEELTGTQLGSAA
ncbi:MAG: toll/interleukin-1 receptor domain-containing protein [Stackebrandtia sp.]